MKSALFRNKDRMTPCVVLPMVLVLFALAGWPAAAQKANFELAERFTTQRMEKMVGSTQVNASWIKNQDRFWYEYETSEGKFWYMVDAARRTKQPLFDQQEMAARLTEVLGKPYNHKDLPLKEFKYDVDRGVFTFHVDSIQFTYDLETRTLTKGDSLKKKPDTRWATYSPDSTWIVFARHHNLFLMRANDPDSTEYQLTTDGERWFSYQQEEGDTSTTKRMRSRAVWFKDSRKLYVKRQDKRKVGDLWVIHSLKKRPELETYKYPMPGEKHVPQDELQVFDVETRQGVKIKAEKWPDQALGGTYFNKSGIFITERSDYLYFIRRDRPWQKLDVCRADTRTGEVEVLFSEESKPYFNTRFADLAIINEGQEYIWWSERNGWGQLYLYDSQGRLKHKITDGYFTVGRIEAIDTTRRIIYFEGYGREPGVNPYYSMKYRIGFDGKGLTLLTPEVATHSFSMSDSKRYFVDTYSRVDMAPVSVLRDSRGRVVMELERTDLSRMVEAGWKMPETFTVKAADDATDLYGVMWKPFDFDSTRKYPIIAYVYPGPQTEPFPIGFTISGSRARPVALAQLGFIVVAFGQRGGSPLRSKYYHNYGYGDLRDYALADNRYGIEQLAARYPFIDLNRVGIFGHSGGGFMSTAAILTYPDFYKVAVSSAGNHDNNIYNMWWSEVHNGVKQKTRKVKKKKEDGTEEEVEETVWEAKVESNAELAKNLKGHLLLVHGEVDNNVHPANTLRLADALIKAGKRFDMMILPGKRHGFGNYTPYFERLMWYYFAEHLLGDYRDDVELNLPEESQ